MRQLRPAISAKLFVLGICLALLAAPSQTLAQTGEPGANEAGIVATPAADPFTWWMESRYEMGWKVYDPHNHIYRRDYLFPDGYEVGFDACNSPLNTGGTPNSYAWNFEGSGLTSPLTINSAECVLSNKTSQQSPLLPQGDYLVTLTVGFADQASKSGSLAVKIKDLLIVSIGDSNASGEGNPMIGVVESGTPDWWDQRCHRSSRSGHAFAAAKIESEDPHTSVTFISFACSGAEVMEGLVLPYEGIDSPGSGLFVQPPPQLKNVMNHLCGVQQGGTTCTSQPRKIDALFMSIGINDVKFSNILKVCADLDSLSDLSWSDIAPVGALDLLTSFDWDEMKDRALDVAFGPLDELFSTLLGWTFNFFGADTFDCIKGLDPIYNVNLSALWSHYDLLAMMFQGNTQAVVDDAKNYGWRFQWLPNSMRKEIESIYGNLDPSILISIQYGAVYINAYPVDLFGTRTGGGDGCGIFELGIGDDEGDWMYQKGVQLNEHIAWAAEKHRWHYADGIVELFDGHSYCASDTYYVGLYDSLIYQHDINGTVHPNGNGHGKTAERLIAAYKAPKTDESLKWGIHVVFDQVKIEDWRTYGQVNEAIFLGRVEDDWNRYDPLIAMHLFTLGNDTLNQGWETLDPEVFAYMQSARGYEEITVSSYARLGALESNACQAPCVPDNFPSEVTDQADEGLNVDMTNVQPMSIALCKNSPCPTGSNPPTLLAKFTLKPGNDYAATDTTDGTNCSNVSTPTDTIRGTRRYSCEQIKQNTLAGKEMFMGVRFHVTITNLKNPLLPVVTAPIWKVCADYCDTASTSLPSMNNYVHVLQSNGRDAVFAGRSQALMGQNVPSVHRWTLDFDLGDDNAYGVALQPDGKFVIAGDAETSGINSQQIALARYTRYGARDVTFGDGGFVLGGLHDVDAGRAVAIQPDGKIVVAGFRGSSSVDFGVWRFTKSGKPDGTFNLLGFNVTDFGRGNDYGQAVLLQADGKIIVAGFAADGNPNGYDFGLVRYNPNGTLDKSFGVDGLVRTNIGAGYVRARAAALQADGKILVAGGHEGNFIVVRYMPDGSLDQSFGEHGIREINSSGNDIAQAIAVTPGGRIIVVGYSNWTPPVSQPTTQSAPEEQIAAEADSSGDFGLVLLEPDGSLCACGAAATEPILRTDFGGDEIAYAVALQSDGRIVVAGGRRTSNSQILLARYRFSVLHGIGYRLDTSFGDNGKKSIPLGSYSVARAIGIDANNRMTIAGYSNSGGDNEFAIERDIVSVIKTASPARKIHLPFIQK